MVGRRRGDKGRCWTGGGRRCGAGGGRMGVGTSGGAGIVIVGGEESGGAKVCTHSATSVTKEVCVAPPSEVYPRVGTQPAWR